MAVYSNMFNPERIDLGKAIPLQAPLVIQLEASGYCNLACSFCPHGQAASRELLDKANLSEELFDLFLEQCCEFPDKIKNLRFIGVGEPLVNRGIPSFVAKAKQSGVFEKVEITTNGVLLSRSMSDSLIEAGLDVLLVSLEAIDEQRFFEIAGKHICIQELKDNLSYFYSQKGAAKLYIKSIDAGLQDSDLFLKEYGAICDYIYVENIIENWPEFHADSKERAVRYNLAAYTDVKQVCIQPFKLLCVAANGDVMPCSVDWKRVWKLGNIQERSLMDIWNGDSLRKLRLLLLTDEAQGICRVCGYTRQNQPDTIDAYANDIVARLKGTL